MSRPARTVEQESSIQEMGKKDELCSIILKHTHFKFIVSDSHSQKFPCVLLFKVFAFLFLSIYMLPKIPLFFSPSTQISVPLFPATCFITKIICLCFFSLKISQMLSFSDIPHVDHYARFYVFNDVNLLTYNQFHSWYKLCLYCIAF